MNDLTTIEILFMVLLFGGGLSLGFAVLGGIANLIEGWQIVGRCLQEDD
jgi:hypothetical protein